MTDWWYTRSEAETGCSGEVAGFEMLHIEPMFTWMANGAIYPELLLIPFLMCLAVVVGLLPALAAYRTNVGRIIGR